MHERPATGERRPDAGRRAKLIRQALGYVPSVARRYLGNGADLDELIAAGNLGLVEAARRFDPRRNVRFLTYADWWVRKAILQAIEALAGPVRLPRYRYERLRRLKQAGNRWAHRHGAAPTMDELASVTGLPAKRVERLISTEPRTVSLDQPPHAQDDRPLGESLQDPELRSPQQRLVRRDLGRHLRRELDLLDEREKAVMRLRFGLDGEPPRTLRTCARVLGISRERVRQIELRVVLRIRRVL